MKHTVQINTEASESPSFAAQIVNTAYSYDSTIQIQSGNKKVSAKSLIGLISLMLTNGEYVTLYADGPDAADATSALTNYLCSGSC